MANYRITASVKYVLKSAPSR